MQRQMVEFEWPTQQVRSCVIASAGWRVAAAFLGTFGDTAVCAYCERPGAIRFSFADIARNRSVMQNLREATFTCLEIFVEEVLVQLVKDPGKRCITSNFGRKMAVVASALFAVRARHAVSFTLCRIAMIAKKCGANFRAGARQGLVGLCQ